MSFLTDNIDGADKSARLAAISQAPDPEDLKTPAQLQAERADLSFIENVQPKKHTSSDETEDHWSAVLKRLAPAGYSKSPAWQQRIIEKVFKKMTKRQKEAGSSSLSKEQMAHTIDLAAIGLSAEMAAAIRAEDQRMAASLRDLPKMDPGHKTSVEGASERSNAAKSLAERQNKVWREGGWEEAGGSGNQNTRENEGQGGEAKWRGSGWGRGSAVGNRN